MPKEPEKTDIRGLIARMGETQRQLESAVVGTAKPPHVAPEPGERGNHVNQLCANTGNLKLSNCTVERSRYAAAEDLWPVDLRIAGSVAYLSA